MLSVHEGESGYWELQRSVDGVPVPEVYVRFETEFDWKLCDETGSQYDGAAIRIGRMLDGIGVSWPAEEEFAIQAQRILRHNADLRAVLRMFLPWMPILIRKKYTASAERRARLAFLFLRVLESLGDAQQTQTRLERLAYDSLSTVYEEEPADSSRFRTLEQAWRRAFRAWYGAVADDERAWGFMLEPPQRRELAMCRILTYRDARRRRLRRYFREERRGREAVGTVITRWFLPRYDLVGAEHLKGAVKSAAQSPEKGGYLDTAGTRWPTLDRWSRRLAWVALLTYIIIALSPVWKLIERTPAVRSIPLVMGVVYLLGLGIPMGFWLKSGAPDTSVPRLWAGIFLAIVGTIMQQNWDNIQMFGQIHPYALLGISLFLLLAAYKVMLTKIRHATAFKGKSIAHIKAWWGDPAHRRSRTLWSVGLTRGFLVSLLLTDLLGDVYVRRPCLTSSFLVPHLPGGFGRTYPALVILFAALALFAGIFAQLLWEEKPLTEGVI